MAGRHAQDLLDGRRTAAAAVRAARPLAYQQVDPGHVDGGNLLGCQVLEPACRGRQVETLGRRGPLFQVGREGGDPVLRGPASRERRGIDSGSRNGPAKGGQRLAVRPGRVLGPG
jgi:hypothetical protein